MSQRRPVVAIFISLLMNLIGFAIVIPYEAQYAKETVGVPAVLLGPLFGSFYFAFVFASPVMGALLDRFGRRPVLLGGLVLSALSYLLLASATTPAVMFAARILDGFTGSNVVTARAYIADSTTEKTRAQGMSYLGIAYGVAFILGPILGLQILYPLGERVPIYGAAALSIASLVWSFFAVPETYARTSMRVNPLKAIGGVLSRAHLRHLALVIICYWGAFSAFYASVMVFVAPRFHLTPDQIGPLLGALGLTSTLTHTPLVYGRVVRKLGERTTAAVGLVLAAAGLGVGSQLYELAPFVASLLLVSVGIPLAGPSIQSLISRSGRRDEQGRLQGGMAAIEYLSRGVGPIVGFALLNAVSAGASFLGLALLMAIGGVIASFYKGPVGVSEGLQVERATA